MNDEIRIRKEIFSKIKELYRLSKNEERFIPGKTRWRN